MQSGIGVWMKNARLIARADGLTGGPVPTCANRFVANLTAKLPVILEPDGDIPQQLRDLRALLVLQRALVFLSHVAPMSSERLCDRAAARFSGNDR
jgi:hypothetical protein